MSPFAESLPRACYSSAIVPPPRYLLVATPSSLPPPGYSLLAAFLAAFLFAYDDVAPTLLLHLALLSSPSTRSPSSCLLLFVVVVRRLLTRLHLSTRSSPPDILHPPSSIPLAVLLLSLSLSLFLLLLLLLLLLLIAMPPRAAGSPSPHAPLVSRPSPSHPSHLHQGALMHKWNAARAEAEHEDRMDAEAARDPSLELIEERKRKRIADWKETLPEEATERNNNFAPLGGDWRERVAKARKKKAADGQ